MEQLMTHEHLNQIHRLNKCIEQSADPSLPFTELYAIVLGIALFHLRTLMTPDQLVELLQQQIHALHHVPVPHPHQIN
jgi:hypothetical protein